MTFKLYFFYLNIPGICTSEVSSFALFRFLDVLIGCREKNFKLGPTTLFNNKIFKKDTLIIKSYELQYLQFHYFTVYTPLICPPSLNRYIFV